MLKDATPLDFPGDPYESKVVHDVNIILDDPEVAIVCETMGASFNTSSKSAPSAAIFERI